MNELESNVLHYIGEDPENPDVFTEGSDSLLQIRNSINDAIQEIAILTGGNKRDYHLPLRSGGMFYRMTWNEDQFGWITDAWLINIQRRLERTDIPRLKSFNPRWLENTGSPHSYLTIGLNIVGVWPRPTSDSDIIVFSCVTIPNQYTTDIQRIKARDDYKWAAVFYAVSEYWASRGDATTAYQFFDKYVEKMGLNDTVPNYADYRPGLRTNKELYPKATG